MLVEAVGVGREVGREESAEETAGFEAPMDWLARVAAWIVFAAGARRLPTARGTNAGAAIGFDEVEGGGPSSGAGEPVVAADGVAGPEKSESGVSIANEASGCEARKVPKVKREKSLAHTDSRFSGWAARKDNE